MQTPRMFLALVVASLPFQHVLAREEPLNPPPLYARIATLFARQFPRHHLTRSSLDDPIARRAWTNYLDSLDFRHVYFLQSDISEFEAEQTTLDDRLEQGEMRFAYRVFAVFKKRLKDRYDYVCRLLDKGFDLGKQETYRWKREGAPWPADRAEWDDLWRRKIKNEYVLIVVNRELAAEARARGESGEDDDPDAGRPPDEVIRKRYKQMLTVMEDSDEEWVLQKYLTAFAHAYDPHSGYMSSSNVEDFNIEMKLSLVGIGALLRAEDGAAKIVRLIPGGPADRDQREKSLQPGDKIIEVAQGDGEPVDIRHQPLYKVVRLIRGEKGTRVVLTVIPASDPTGSITKKVDLIRDEVKLEEQAASSRIVDGEDLYGNRLKLGIITLPAFYANMNVRFIAHPDYRSAAYDVEKELDSMKAKGVQGVLVDLRNNGGGALNEAIKMTGLFIGTGPVVQVAERHRRRTLYDRDPSVAYAGPLVVLVNRFSASASEIVAGALQDYGRAVIVGDTKTHGKGTVQSLVKLGLNRRLGSAKITTASYYRVSGGSTQLKGIAADIVLPSPFDAMELGEESLPNAIAWSTISPAPFFPVADLDDTISGLRRKSETRRRQAEDFVAYRQLLDRVKGLQDVDELPLAIDDRRALARTEKEIADLRRDLAPGSRFGEEIDHRHEADPVLRESLNILEDLIAAKRHPAPEPQAGHTAVRSGGSDL